LLLLVVGCKEESNTSIYTIEGRLIDGTNPSNKFANLHLEFLNEYDQKNIKTLGETTTDANGYFKLTYEFSNNYQLNFMRINIDTNIITSNKLRSIQIGANWNSNFYLGDSAAFNLYIDQALTKNDTLFFNTWDSTYSVIGPYSSGLIRNFKCFNYNPRTD